MGKLDNLHHIKLTLRNHLGTLLFLSPRKYKLMTMTDRNVDNVMSIMFKQKYAPERKVYITQFKHYSDH